MRKSLIFNDYANTPGEIINDLWKFPTVISQHNKTGKERQWMIFIGTNRGMNKEWFINDSAIPPDIEVRTFTISGQIDGKMLPGEEVIVLSKLPGINEMRAILLGLFTMPMSLTLSVMEAMTAKQLSVNEQKSESDLDVLVEYEKTPGFFSFVRLEEELSKLLGVQVDLVMKSALKPHIGKIILDEVQYL